MSDTIFLTLLDHNSRKAPTQVVSRGRIMLLHCTLPRQHSRCRIRTMALRLTTISDCFYSAFIFRKEQTLSGLLVVSARKTKHP